jgi:hypothetical protein
MLSPWPRSWDYDNPIENKSKQIIKLNLESTQCWRRKLKKKSIKKRPKKLSELTCYTYDSGYKIEITL